MSSPSPELFLSVDIGTTAMKVGLFTTEGKLIALSSQSYELLKPRPGYVELPVERYFEAFTAGVAECLAGQQREAVRAIGLSSQGQTFAAFDKGMNPLTNALSWLDTRATEETRQLAERFSREEFYQRTGVPNFNEIASAPKIRWLARHQPEVFTRTAKYLMLPDYLTWQLTGELVGDPQDLSSMALMDEGTGDWWPEMLEVVGVTPEQLPRIGKSGEVVGRILPSVAARIGLSNKTLVVVGANDQTTAMLGAGNVRPGVVSANIGTALAVMASSEQAPASWRSGVSFGAHAVPGLQGLLSFTQTAAMALAWFRNTLAGEAVSFHELDEEAARVPPGAEGLIMLPHLTGTASPDFNAEARGAFIGLSLAHTRGHLLRAILESIAFCLREHVERLAAVAGPCETIRALGGGAKSALWLQILADVTGLPVERPACSEAASLGAALLAAVGAGYFASIEDAAIAWYSADRLFEPEAALGPGYEACYERFEKAYKVLYAKE